jgi:hypothetical protein
VPEPAEGGPSCPKVGLAEADSDPGTCGALPADGGCWNGMLLAGGLAVGIILACKRGCGGGTLLGSDGILGKNGTKCSSLSSSSSSSIFSSC